MSRNLASAYDLPTVWFWQPSRVSRPPVAGEPSMPDDAAKRQVDRAAASALPDRVIDLSTVLAGDPRPFFADEVRHNEEAARIIAAAMYRSMRGRLDQLVASDR